MNNKKMIGNNLNTALAVRSVQQRELADAIGVLPNVVSYFCSGARTPNTQQLMDIADYLDVTTDFLLGRSKVINQDADFKEAADYFGLTDGKAIVLRQLKESNSRNLDYVNTILANSAFYQALSYLAKAEAIEKSKTKEERKNPDDFDNQCKFIDYMNMVAIVSGQDPDKLQESKNQRIETSLQSAAGRMKALFEYIVKRGAGNGKR